MDVKIEQIGTISSEISYVLDQVGASEYIRRTRQNGSVTEDVLASVDECLQGHPVSVYTFGSASEGTTTPGLQSDTDILMCFDDLPVHEWCNDRLDNGICLLMMQDDLTPPGYTKLVYTSDVIDDKNQCVNSLSVIDTLAQDINGLSVLANGEMIENMEHDERNGPAGTTLKKPGFTDLDYVPAFRYAGWPSQANEWLQRNRRFDFLGPTVNADFRALGCFFVSVGHPTLGEKHLQWRISFSLQERKIMFNLNEVQYKCYVLMKMIKKDFITPNVTGKSLTSYHCKTCLFYIIEKTDTSLWTIKNLLACFTKCIYTIKLWVANGYIPNYFIPSENMWKGTNEMKVQVASILENVLQSNPAFLFNICCDNIGTLLADNTSKATISNCSADLVAHHLHIQAVGQIVRHAKDIIGYARNDNDIETCIRAHYNIISFFSKPSDISKAVKQAEEYVKNASDAILPFIHTSLGSQLAATEGVAPSTRNEESTVHLRKGEHSDALSGYVKNAAVLFMKERFKECKDILQHLHENLPVDVTSLGMCNEQSHENANSVQLQVNECLVTKIRDRNLTLIDVLRQSVATCNIYLPTEVAFIPRDLQFEMFGIEKRLQSKAETIYNDVVMIDSKVYMYYLLYRVHEKLGNIREKQTALLHLIMVSECDNNLCHTASAHNLLGCIYKEVGKIGLAIESFCTALTSGNNPNAVNAAKWHLGILLCELVTEGKAAIAGNEDIFNC